MKKILLALGVLVLIAVAGVAVLIATFDANRFKPMIEKKISEAVGNPASIGSVKLAWNGALAVEVSDVIIREDGKTAFGVKRASAGLDIWGLLSKQVRFSSIEITEPNVAVLRDAAGVIRVQGIRPPASQKKPAAPASAASASAADLSIRSFRVRNGRVTLVDASSIPPMMIPVQDLNVDVQNAAIGSEIRLTASAAVFAERKNLEVSGKATVQLTGAFELRDGVIKTDLSLLDWKKLKANVPAAANLPFTKDPSGLVTVKAAFLKIPTGGAAPDYKVQLEVVGGALELAGFRPAISNIGLVAQVTPSVMTVNSFGAALAGGSVVMSGDVQEWAGSSRTRLKLEAKQLRIEQMMPEAKTGKTQFEGELGAAFDGGFASFEWPVIRKNLSGRAVIDLPKGLLLNMNLVREAIGKLDALFPGIVAEVESRLPAAYKPKLTQQSTVLTPFRHQFEIANGIVMIRDLSVATDFFAAGASGDLALEGTFEGIGSIRMDQTFSKAMFDGVPLVSVLANAASQVELPLKLRYRNNKFSALPDLDAIGKRLIPQSGKQLLNQALGLGAALGGSSAGSASAAGGEASVGGAVSAGGSSSGGWLSQIQNIAGAAIDSQNGSSS